MFHEITIIGHLGTDPEMRYTPSGTAVTNFSVAANRKWKGVDGGEGGEETIWFRVAAWNRLAEICNEYLSKGRQVFMKGRLKPTKRGNPRVWTGQDGEARASYEITLSTIKFLGSKGGAPASQGAPPASATPPAEEAEEIPF